MRFPSLTSPPFPPRPSLPPSPPPCGCGPPACCCPPSGFAPPSGFFSCCVCCCGAAVGAGAGALTGEMIGSGLAQTAQSIGPYYAKALEKNPKDPSTALETALAQAAADGAITGVSFRLFHYAPEAIKSTLGKVALQALGIQPALAATGQVAQGVISGEKVTPESLAAAYPASVIGTAVPLVGTHLAGKAADRFLPKREVPPSQADLEALTGGITGEDIARARENSPSAFRYDSDWYSGEEPSLFPGGLSSEGIPQEEAAPEAPAVKRSTATTGSTLVPATR